jgi:predicted glycoside hydrolase/deacetylase ChbG (UPF0249 family)
VTRRLIINADDLGMTPGVTRGIVECMKDGVVSSTTLMVNMPAAPEAAALALRHQLAVGLHLNLTTGRPVLPPSQVPSLVRTDGVFHSHEEFRRRLLSVGISTREVCRELAAQIDTARRLGIEPTHIDTHHHLHLWLPIAIAMLIVGRRTGILKTRTTRTTDMVVPMARSRSLRGWAKRRYKSAVAALLGRWFRMPAWRMEASALRADRGVGAHSGLDEWLLLIRELEKLPAAQIVEVSCHPGYVDAELPHLAKYVSDRPEEIATLTSRQLKVAMSRAGIELVNFRDL